MSIRCSARVWKYSRSKGSTKLILLAVADHAHDDGTGAWPSQTTLAEKTGLSERTVRRELKRLEQMGELRAVKREGLTTLFSVTTPDKLSNSTPDKLSPTPDAGGLGTQAIDGLRTVLEPSKKEETSSSLESVASRLAEEWRITRKQEGLEKFSDPLALRWLHDAINKSDRAPKDIEKAVRTHVEEEFSDPRQLERWLEDIELEFYCDKCEHAWVGDRCRKGHMPQRETS